MSEENTTKQEEWRYWRIRVFVTVWVTYMTYYIGRTNIGIAKPFIIEEFGIEPATFGLIGMAMFLMYAIGQFVNGVLGDKFGSRKLVSLGLIVSAFINLIFGFADTIFGTAGSLVMMMFILWGMNGFFQSMGWAPSVKTTANWFPPKERGKWSGRLGT